MARIVANPPVGARAVAVSRSLVLALAAVGAGAPAPAATEVIEVIMDRAAKQAESSPAPAASPADLAAGLPPVVAAWSRRGPARTVTPATIFEYMDGAGELYLAYRFARLDVVEYGSKTAGDILVELYRMASSDDAFGLLSGDWGGEPVELRPGTGGASGAWPRALYGSGLLRIWSDDLYARVLATRESEAARAAVLALGRAIAQGRAVPPPPRLSGVPPASVGTGFRLRRDRLCFFRSHLVLNSIYFLSQRDVLDLGPSVEAVIVPYEREGEGSRRAKATVVAVRYPTPEAARLALARFRAAYAPEAEREPEQGVQRIEDGWLAFRLVGPAIALVFEAPDRETAGSLLNGVSSGLERQEGSHG